MSVYPSLLRSGVRGSPQWSTGAAACARKYGREGKGRQDLAVISKGSAQARDDRITDMKLVVAFMLVIGLPLIAWWAIARARS